MCVNSRWVASCGGWHLVVCGLAPRWKLSDKLIALVLVCVYCLVPLEIAL